MTAHGDDAASVEAAGIRPAQVCAAGVNAAAARGVSVAFESHKAWWAAYWPQSFVSLPITRIEGYYYSQMCLLHWLSLAICFYCMCYTFTLPLSLQSFDSEIDSLEQVPIP